MSRTVIAFDFGTKNIGTAIGQDVTHTASPLQALKANNGIPNWNEIDKHIKTWKPNLLVVGLPIDLYDKDLSNLTLKTKRFAKYMQNYFKLPVELHDERFSTTEARSLLFDSGGYKALSKNNVDCQSAVIILESWFEHN
ncbi:Holliday junction resolvase [Candidatus Photodesmus katoptron]|uniref:Putative pre-16S rRNA nuclease n=1 Tax=Candidatus Photodesmus katoptron Akat1 TaxID=1236703 RepID=S3DZB8_9GAMM|nr:Holliday junction resolvase RuvX [Candidatus Photodesmus katoptron]EPE37261.1 hypothetical protein O1U_0561 [Candidatus Photodesmus katoptron Akat1]KEY90082.1 Holliday junction resolvase [Candidatus Photodesmus katoptron]